MSIKVISFIGNGEGSVNINTFLQIRKGLCSKFRKWQPGTHRHPNNLDNSCASLDFKQSRVASQILFHFNLTTPSPNPNPHCSFAFPMPYSTQMSKGHSVIIGSRAEALDPDQTDTV